MNSPLLNIPSSQPAPGVPAQAPAAAAVPVAPAAAAGTDTLAQASAQFIDLLRTLGASVPVAPEVVSAGDGTATGDDQTDTEAETDTSPADRLPSQSLLPSALHAALMAPAADTRRQVARPDAATADAVTAAGASAQPAASAALPSSSPGAVAELATVPAAATSLRTDRAAAAPAATSDTFEAVPVAQVTASAAPAAAPQNNPGDSADAVLTLKPSAPESWQQPLTEALGERLQMQSGRHGERAVIRLDPPALGRIEIVVQQDAAGAIQVQLSASNGEVLRQLHTMGDTLRQDLGQRQQADVTVVVSDGSRDMDGRSRSGQQQQPREQGRPGDALAEAETGFKDKGFTLASEGNA
ncbi:flagellar hook-length control protein FliK [Methyloversatilis thermotolerans]|uniref:flagellar hook-length control protein FliK n=1 Tax=Methyloversatilis thermotolerans TaxID=1346290 RepID=UPI000374563A|nr:flagellar hook-length control protein FliK [Methyloversatilis thermotolerans]